MEKLSAGLAIDACTVFNSKLMAGEMIGIVMALAGYVGLLIFELVVLIRFRKNTEKTRQANARMFTRKQ